MVRLSGVYVSAIALFLSSSALAQTPQMKVEVSGIKEGEMMPNRFAYCIPDGKGHSSNGENRNPEIRWSGAPEGTKSYVLLVVDSDVPVDFSKAYRDDLMIKSDSQRRDFYHWVLFDIPATVHEIKEGANSTQVIVDGKPVGKTAYGTNGRNDYGAYKEKITGGYDGPCPPWNDEKMHHYHFQILALNVDSINLHDDADGTTVKQAIESHIIAAGKLTGTYSLNPTLLKK